MIMIEIVSRIVAFYSRGLLQLLKRMHLRRGFPERYRALNKMLSKYFIGKEKVLDLGCSDGELAALIGSTVGTKFFGVDVLLGRDCAVPSVLYDGIHLPFRGKIFDAVLISDVLHHCDRMETVFEEAIRVSSGSIVIKDHYYNNELDRFFLKLADYIGNRPFGVNLPYRYLSLSKWHQLFQKYGLKVVTEKKFRFSSADTCKQVIFILNRV